MEIKKLKIFREIIDKTNDDHFYNALKITLCTIISFGFFYHSFGVSFAFGMTLGACLCSPIDISSNLKDKVIGLSIAAIIVPIISIILTLTYEYNILFYMVFGLLVFFSSLIALYGLRATQLSFTLLLGICLSFIHITSKVDAVTNGLHMFYGGLLYLIISIIFFLIRPSKFIDLELANCINNVAKYLQLRAQLWGDHPDINSIHNQQLSIQVTINDSFQKINQYLEYNKTRVINSTKNRKIILATSFLHEIMELAVTTTFNSRDIELRINKETAIKTEIQEMTEYFSANLQTLALSVKHRTTYNPSYSLTDKFTQIFDEVNKITDLTSDNKLYLDSVVDYLNKQIKKIQSLERVFTEKINTSDLDMDYKSIEKYFTPHHYRFKTLIENLNFKSTYCRYAMRITIAMLIGLFFGDFMALEKEYWVLMTIAVIMRPGYGLTKTRMHQRIIGTVIGGIVGILILQFISSTLILAILTAIAMLLGYWYTSSDYKIGVTFVTLYIILIYGILKTGAEVSVVYRITDTLTGAFIALLATNYLWPSWEINSIKNTLIASINSTIAYINQFKDLYVQKVTDTFQLEQTRQSAFIAIGNLMASYQRLVQEPKDKQINRAELYEIAVINQTLVGAVASLGTFIRAHQDNANFKSYGKIFNTIIYNLDLSLSHFGQSSLVVNDQDICTATDIANIQVEQKKALNTGDTSDDEQRTKLEESQIVFDQLNWIMNLSEQIENTAKNIQ